MEPLISIITVTYNAADVITPTMESVAAQTYRNFEHLVIDGASTDDTLGIVRKLGSENLTIYSKKDNGIYHGMNRGLKLAEGKYVLFLNAGDSFASPEILSLYAMEAENGADIIYGETVIVDSERRIIRPRHLKVPKILTKQSFSRGMLICHQAFMVRKEIAPNYSKEFKFSADYDWTIRCIEASRPGKNVNLETVTTHYLDNGTTEKNKIASLKERYKIMQSHYGSIPTFLLHLSFIPRMIKRRIKQR